MNIVLFEPHEIREQCTVILSPHDARTVHILNILHKTVGDTFNAGIYESSVGTALIHSIDCNGFLSCSLHCTVPSPTRFPIYVVAGFVRPIQLRRILRDMATMGIESVDLVSMDNSEKSYQHTKLLSNGGAKRVFLEGAIQARDSSIPLIHMYKDLDTWLDQTVLASGTLLVTADNVNPDGSFRDIVTISPRPICIVIVIGPERGFSERERILLENAHFKRFSLGNRPLRTETACVAAVSIAELIFA
ncbi:putative 16S rRNA (uracil1498-N3)-methyltransferase [Pillotina sp. SPG140]